MYDPVSQSSFSLRFEDERSVDDENWKINHVRQEDEFQNFRLSLSPDFSDNDFQSFISEDLVIFNFVEKRAEVGEYSFFEQKVELDFAHVDCLL